MSYGRPAQSKAQNESNAKILRALVKQPDNKVCVDCKRNDPRWASWNLGCFLCIRCSGIHRSMGTHISKVKSIDLDIWTPEQMSSVQKWGNRRANLYWEAHLKSGHVPPDHKVESFIRSKYELKRWAKDGPMPSDPTVLDGGSAAASNAEASEAKATTSATATTSASAARPAPKATVLDLLGGDPAPSAPTTGVTRSSASNLLDDDFAAAPSTRTATATQPAQTSRGTVSAAPPQPASKPSGAGGGLFDLDWHDGASAAATSATSPRLSGSSARTGSKSDILSLYATAKPAALPAPTSPQQGGLANLNSSFGGLSMAGGGAAAPAAATSNPWSPTAQTTSFNSSSAFGGATDPWASSTTASNAGFGGGSDIWGNATSNTSTNNVGNGFAAAATVKKNDAFDDIWSDFK